jgi:hypothetical protein
MRITFTDRIFLLMIFFIGFSTSAFAYLDPGSGSLILQIVIAGLLAGSMFFKRIWYFIKNIFAKKSSDDE